MGISMNGPSGIDTASIIDSLVQLERQRVYRVEARKKDYQVQIDAYSKLNSLLSDIGTKAAALDSSTGFDLFEATSSNESVATLTAGIGAFEGSYGLEVFRLAEREKMVSADGLITDQHASLSSQGITVGTVNIDGVELTVGAEDSLQDLRSKINNATDADGNKLGVTASVLKLADNNYRLVLTAEETGSAGVAYQDVSGSTLQDLGIIADAAGSKGSVAQVLRSDTDVQTQFTGLAVGDTVTYSGIDSDGNEVTATYVKGSSDTIDDLLAHMEKNFHGMVDASVDGTGNLVLTDKVAGASQLSMSSMSVGTNAVTMGLNTVGENGAGVLAAGRDALFAVDGIAMSSSSNTASDFVAGVSFEFHQASIGETVTLDVSRDHAGIEEKVTDLLNAYNALLRFAGRSTSYANPEDSDSQDGKLAGDMTVNSIVSRVRTTFQKSFSDVNEVYTTLSMVGVETDSKTGELSLDSEAFRSALEDRYDEVLRLFVKDGYSDNTAVQFGRSTEETQGGVYTIEEVDADHVRIQLAGDTTWYTSDARNGDIVTFSDGPATGLSLTLPSGSLGGTTSTFTFNKGIGALQDELVGRMTDTHDGIVSMRQKSLNRSIDSADDRIVQLEDRIERYRMRLVKQFSAMEQNLSELRSQSANMMSALGGAM